MNTDLIVLTLQGGIAWWAFKAGHKVTAGFALAIAMQTASAMFFKKK